MRNLLIGIIEGRRALYFIVVCIVVIIALSGILGCKTPSTIASEQWTKNAVAIEGLREEKEKAETRLENEKKKEKPNQKYISALEKRIKALSDAEEALRQSNQKIGEQTARADIAEKNLAVAEAALYKWFFYGLAGGLGLGIAGTFLVRRFVS